MAKIAPERMGEFSSQTKAKGNFRTDPLLYVQNVCRTVCNRKQFGPYLSQDQCNTIRRSGQPRTAQLASWSWL